MRSPQPVSHHPSHSRSGFTLGEVLMAMLIISFAILVLIGLLPSALSSMSKSAQMSAESRIVQYLQATYDSAFTGAQTQAELSALRSRRQFSFDARGAPVTAAAANYRDTFFLVTCEGTDTPLMPGESQPSPFLQTISAVVINNYHGTDAPSTSTISGADGPILNTHVYRLTFVSRHPLPINAIP